MKVLVTGSRGYIGSVLVKTLCQDPTNIVWGVDTDPRPDGSTLFGLFSEANINEDIIADIVVAEGYDTIFHLAASADVGESMRSPAAFYLNNIGNTSSFLNNLITRNWKGKFIFSSTAAVYQEQKTRAVFETSPIDSPNAYGRSKYACEQLLYDVSKAHDIRVGVFRYFNVAGAWDDVGDHSNSGHIIQRLCHSVNSNIPFTLYGNKKQTKSGTCVRDYLHVRDVCDAHIHLANYMDLYDIPIQTYNLGTGQGWSNIDIIKSFEIFTGRKVEYVIGPDRPGDPDLLIAGANKFVDTTGYRYNHSNIENIITSAWNYYSNN